MKAILAIVLGFSLASGGAAAEDLAGSGDHPLLPRYPGSEICAFERHDYDEYALVSGSARAKDEIPVKTLEGRITRNMYVLRDESRSPLEVMRNYQIALQEAGFEELFSCSKDDCAEGAAYRTYFFFRANPNLHMRCRLPDLADWSMPSKEPRYFSARLIQGPGGGVIHVAVTVAAWKLRGGGGPRYLFVQADVVEQEAMAVGMELKLADEMASDIDTAGRAVLYDILFDTGSDQLKAQSQQSLKEIAKLLGSRPELGLLVVGHTDAQGQLDYNLDLSTRRAQAVVKALVGQYGIAAGRLSGHGVAFLAPVATNKTKEGRALNRRVELIER